jgi:hypothetical protein
LRGYKFKSVRNKLTQNTQKCHFQTEICDETYTKNCAITFLQESSNVNVVVCYNKAGKICNDEKTREAKNFKTSSEEAEADESNKESDDETITCVEVFETGCYFILIFFALHKLFPVFSLCRDMLCCNGIYQLLLI